MSTTIALAAAELGKRYKRGWALRGCGFELPAGRVAALVGPNGAGKSTLMALATGLLTPTTGTIRIFGDQPVRSGTHPKLGFLAQDKPLFRRFTVAETLHAGRALNPTWDQAYAERLIAEAGVPTQARINTLSGGQRTRVALAVALGRRPELLMLDEPLADLDPVARDEVMQTLMAEVAETGMTVLLSSHVLAELDGVCDHLLVLAGGGVRLSGDVDDLLAEHQLLIGPSEDSAGLFPTGSVVESRSTGRQATVLVRGAAPVDRPGWVAHEPTLEELVKAYLRSAGKAKAVAEAVSA
ncbi:ABC-2 type transport system ATP-binding protein [Goodfellowiella coeruleoviolacea]|uniref:ABC-2 type transport system ATP-binding protein n=1 Tax=Goodfellowiella coeruleoviolacea TaxID=334858 RepID=A0AAE3GLZ9_9PSEU|nr:ABC transporter ATP-binding protein [Goodfellowiella coeruleoviolacea]MCP2170025.1 ABC-2 type transport system ATP-binding protein [Goodfellowiella coeruleoviolacea]